MNNAIAYTANMQPSQSLIIEGITIRTDTEGRFCLNDLHKAAGGLDKDAPAQFFRNAQTKLLIEELKSDMQICTSLEVNHLEPINIVKGGSGEQGTYVVKELVYAYAMWISAAFNLKVIRTFDSVMTGQPVAKELSKLEILQLALESEQRVIELEHKVIEMQPDVAALERIAKADGSLCIRDAAKALQIRQKDLFDWLKSHRWIYKRAGCSHYLGYQDKDQAGYLEHKVAEVVRSDGTTKITEQVRVTAKGLAKLAKLLGGTGGQPEGVPA